MPVLTAVPRRRNALRWPGHLRVSLLTVLLLFQTATLSAQYGGGPPPFNAAVNPKGAAESIDLFTTERTFVFTTRNVGGMAGTAYMSVACTGVITGCSINVYDAYLTGGQSVTVTARYRGTGAPGTGRITVTAMSQYPTKYDSGWVTITAAAPVVERPPAPPAPPSYVPPPPVPGTMVSVTDANPGANWDRDKCFTISGGPGVAFECGDLRLAHGLPGVQSYGTARAMSLLYNSRAAAATPVVAAYVRTPSPPFGTPTRVTAELLVGPLGGTKTSRAVGEWAGADFTPTSMRRIGFTYAGAGEPSGVYGYAVTVTFWNGGTVLGSATSEDGRLVLVNRSASPYGAGWWPSGVEQLVHLSNGDKAWIGADGSTRHYIKRAGENVWDAGAVDRPDYLSYDGTNWIRWAPHRTRILFDALGQHVATINRHGRRTTFTYVPGVPFQLNKVTVPELTPALYQFSYGSSSMTISAPTANGQTRTTAIQRDGDGIRSICDADYLCMSYDYGYATGEKNLQSVTDRRGTRTDFHYSVGHFLRVMTRDAVGIQAVTSMPYLAEALGVFETGVARSITTDYIYTVAYGPRRTGDWIAAYVNRLGAPIAVTQAGESYTYFGYGDTRFPGLVTKVIAPSGFVTDAIYDANGHLATTIAVNPREDAKNDTTTYTWDTNAWDEMTSVRLPEGETTTFEIDPTTGYRLSQEMPAVAGSRTRFRYTGEGLLQAVQHPTLNNITPTDSVVYDSLRNVALVISPKGYRTRFSHDGIGQTTATGQQTTPGDGTTMQLDSIMYDVMGRAQTEYHYGPALSTGQGLNGNPLTFPATSITVTNVYGAKGDLESTTRTPSSGQVPFLTTRYRYDALGRVVAVVAPDGGVDSTAYDPAGNAIVNVTRNGDILTSTYDQLNRVATSSMPSRSVPAHGSYICELNDCDQHPDLYPRYDLSATGHLTFGAETAVFTYDPLTGQVATANNPSSQVTRTYYRNGALKTETQRVRTVAGTIDPGTHDYTLTYRYDRNGRRVGLQVPDVARPRNSAGTVLGSEIQYSYRTDNGALSTITDLLGNVSTAEYNARGERWKMSLPGAVVTESFDDDGALATSAALWGGGTQLRANTMTYDARGKMTSMIGTAGPKVRIDSWFSGLGQLVHSHSESWDETWLNQTFSADEFFDITALGDIRAAGTTTNYRLSTSGGFLSEGSQSRSTTSKSSQYNATSGRLLSQLDGSGVQETFEYDNAGNTVYMRSFNSTFGMTGEERASFHDASGRLRVTETRQGNTSQFRRTFEESFYDALGRRVLVRTRRACRDPQEIIDKYCELGTVRRTIWDGSGELAEIQQPGGNVATAAEMENDGALTTRQPTRAGDQFNPNPFFGTAVYTYGLHGTDHPVSVMRLHYVDWTTPSTPVVFPPFTITPLWNAVGQMDVGVYPDGSRAYTLQGKTVKLQFPTAWFAYYRSRYLAQAWLGTLLEDKRDASGLHYRRNRYYDPMTGRFTQEDPIGLAGGLNAYGFAGGDPVNYSDPFGLCPEWVDGQPCNLNAAASFAAGFGDALTFGATDWVRDKMGTNDVVDKDGAAYFGGQVGAVIAGAGVGAAAAGASEAGSGKVVIGETMTRVRAAAATHGAETFETGARTAKEIWKANSTWLRGAMRDGKEIIDIGKDATRASRSQFYRAEKALIESRGYPTTVP